MKKYIALLRGINVSGQKKIKMADLKILLENRGFKEVVTYIQSGNVVFKTDEINGLAEKIAKAIKKQYRWDVPVMVKTVPEIEKILSDCPFGDEKKAASYFTLLNAAPSKEAIKEVSTMEYPNEEFMVTDKCVYFFSEKGYGNAKCNNNFFEKKLKVAATTRNYRTLVKLVDLAE